TKSGKYAYRLKQIDNDGSFEYSKIVEVDFVMLDKFTLEQNYPNPFNPTTVISYQIPVNSNVSLKLYDVLGNEVATLVNEYKEAGRYKVELNLGQTMSLSSGIYFYKLQAGEFTEIKKMILSK
ncbi:MAG: T9SS type A sorting domain-containing protein, partial [Ignavibacterium sp.]|nr:T9SS type A sorting domain-containing protein [Ignavibacterium sp.]MDW8375993.1 T9SS type A sorting domain-containing protein [Ignavibacteriales bacterium]